MEMLETPRRLTANWKHNWKQPLLIATHNRSKKSVMNKPDTYNMICFGFLPWSNMWKRNQSMVAEMAKWDFIHKIIFINPIISMRSIFTSKKNGATNGNPGNHLIPSKIDPKIWVYTPFNIFPRRNYLPYFKKIDDQLILKIIKRLNSDKPYILFMNCPNIFSHAVLDALLKKAVLSIFDLSDDFAALGYGNKTIALFKQNTTQYIQASDIVLAVNKHVMNKYLSLNSNMHVLKNATNYWNFDRKVYKRIDFLEEIKARNKTIIGYSGIANMSRIDSDLLDYILDKRPNWNFVFIGQAKTDFKERYSHYKNFFHVPPVHYQTLPDYLNYFDVAIVPFKINEHTKGNDLLKLHDYLAMGKPVVSTEIGGANDLRHVIRVAHRPIDFVNQIEQALGSNTSEDVLKRKNSALENSWNYRIRNIEELIKNHLRT